MSSRAVVIGGGLAGFCSARALSRFFEKVTVIERDELPDGVASRTGLPQARHAHVILDRGRRELERFFPGFEARMLERGASFIDPSLEFASHGAGGWGPRLTTAARMICASRDLTDATIRELAIASVPNLDLRTRTELSALRIERKSSARVAGVELRHRDSGATEQLAPDLVVDASGRGSKVLSLLAQEGVALPEETVIDSDTWYATRWFKSAPGHALPPSSWWKAVILIPTVAGPSGALMAPVEGDRWIVSIATIGQGQPQIDESNFMDKLRALPSPVIAEALGEPISPVHKSRSTPNRRFYFERWTDPVAGFVAVGDAVCALNPIQGQGVSSTAVCAHVLEDALAAEGPASPTLPARFFKAQARWLAEPWGQATGFDLRFPKTTGGKRPFAAKLLTPYIKRLAAAALEDVTLLHQFAEVGQLNQPMASLMSPSVMARVLRASFKRGGPAKAPSVGGYPPPGPPAA